MIFMIAARPLARPPPLLCKFKCLANTLILIYLGHLGHSVVGNVTGPAGAGGGDGSAESKDESGPSNWLPLLAKRLDAFGFDLRFDALSSLGKGSP